jgi:hypothetical protein
MVIRRHFESKRLLRESPLFGWSAELPRTQRREVLTLASKEFGKKTVLSRFEVLRNNWKLINVKRKAEEDMRFVRARL